MKLYPATKGLSVYNALSVAGRDMTPPEIVSFLREWFDPNVDEAYVVRGIAFLVKRSFVKVTGDLVVLPARNPSTKHGWRLERAKDDKELRYAHG